jgi:uncharacterized phage-associated protein
MAHIGAFNERKAAEASAFFLIRSGGHMQLEILKLMKLLYLAERLSYERFGEPLIGDRLVSMPHGPVLSITYNYLNGEIESRNGWTDWINDRSGRLISLKNPERIKSPEDDLRYLSDDDLTILDEIWDNFGAMTATQLRNYTHENCPEWTDPDGSMIPINLNSLFNELGFSANKATECDNTSKIRGSLNLAFKERPL